MEEVWKNKLIFVETPDAPETSVALANYRKVNGNNISNFVSLIIHRHVITAVALYFCLLPEARSQRGLISMEIMVELSSVCHLLAKPAFKVLTQIQCSEFLINTQKAGY